MAHLRSITRKCLTCQKPATVALYSTGNVHMGDYCKACGQRAEKRLNATEAADREARR